MIKVILKPEKGIQIDETKKYLFDPSVVQPYVDASAENATKAEEQANRAEQTFANVSAFVDTSKNEITGIIEQGKTEIATAIDDGRMEISDSILEATDEVKKAGQEAAQEAVQGAADEATRIATEQVNTYVVDVVSPQIQEFVSNAEADAANAAESAELAASEANKSSVFANDSQHYAEDARIWAEGEQAEVEPLGGTLSSMGAADLAYAIANAPEDTPIDASGLFAMNVVKGEKGDKGDKGEDGKDGGGLEIGDVAFAVMGIDESKNLRRYLNGQVISQSQFVSFTSWVKERAKLYPNMVATEENWQAEVTNSKLGQCGKFVIDDELGTIRLPKVVNVQGLADLSLMGSIKAESLPNITGNFTGGNNEGNDPLANGAFATNGKSNEKLNGGDWFRTVMNFNASRSSSTYQDNAPVQQEAIQYPYFIQVATGVEESVDVTSEIELNNPFSLLDYKWSEYELNNASWLISNGAFHSGATYVAVYELLLKIYNGTETKDGVSVKLHEQMMYAYYLAGSYSYWFTTEKVVVGQDVYGYEPFRVCGRVVSVTDTNITIHDDIANSDRTLTRYTNGDSLRSIYTDTDFVLNTSDTTFRLPIKVKLASGNAVVGNGMTLGLTDGSINYGLIEEANIAAGILTTAYGVNVGADARGADAVNKTIGVTTDPLKSGIETSSQGLYLYFYVGETIQDANVINASGVLNQLAGSSKLFDGQWIASGVEIFSSTAVGVYNIDLSEILPDDGYNYEILLNGRCYSSSSNYSTVTLTSGDFIQTTLFHIGTNNRSIVTNTTWVVDSSRQITIQIWDAKVEAWYDPLSLVAYRRIGTNR